MSAVPRAVAPVLAGIGLMLLNGAVLAYMLRKVLARLHVRVGPNRVGPFGMLQTLADAVKLLTKEDSAPSGADRVLFTVAPFAVFVPSLMAYAAIPFSRTLAMARLDSGLLYTFAVLSLIPMGVVMAGWSSSNRWSLLGGMRAAAQQIAYQVPLLLSVIGVVMMAGTLDMGRIVASQQGTWLGFVPRWYVFPQLAGFALFVVAALAALNQTPFDMPGAESELVAGFATEYSGARFGLLFLSEFSNSFVISAVAVTLFFGGWLPDLGLPWLAPMVFLAKVYLGIFVLMWIRGSQPRTRIDQMLSLGWRALIPASLVWILLTGVVLKIVGVGA